MNNPKQKLCIGIAILAVLAGIFGYYLITATHVVNAPYRHDSAAYLIEKASISVENSLSLYETVSMEVVGRVAAKATLDEMILDDSIEKGEKLKVGYYSDGAIIKVDKANNRIEYPEGFPEDILLDASQFQSEKFIIHTDPCIDKKTGTENQYVVLYVNEDGPFYYIRWEPYDKLEKQKKELFNLGESLKDKEKVMNIHLLLFKNQANESGQHEVFCSPSSLPIHKTAEEYGITQEMMDQAGKDISSLNEEELFNLISDFSINDKSYSILLEKIDGTEFTEETIAAYLVPYDNTSRKLLNHIFAILAFFIIIGIVYLVFILSVFRIVRKYRLSKEQSRELCFKTTARRSSAFIAMGSVIIFLSAALLLALFRLLGVYSNVDNSFSVLQNRIEEEKSEADISTKSQIETYENYALMIADILTDQPQYETVRYLNEMNICIDSQYLMIFDHKGNEVISTSEYTGLKLGRDPSSSTYEFRLLLNGAPMITHGLMKDESTNLTNVMIGVRLGEKGDPDGYRALLMAVEKDKIYNAQAATTSDIMKSIVSERMIAFCADPETRTVTASSDDSLTGQDILTLGLPKKALKNGYRDFFTLNGRTYYGECQAIDGLLYYCASEQPHIYSNIWIYSLVTMIVSLVLLTVLAAYMLFGYKRDFEKWAEIGILLEENADEVRTSEGKKKYSLDPSKRWKQALPDEGLHYPYHNGLLALKILMMIFIAVLGFRLLTSIDKGGDSLVSYIMNGHWSKGFNLFSFTSILILLGEVIMVVEVLKLLLRLASAGLGTKGETICRLLLSLLNYLGVVVFFYYAFYDLGFDPKALLYSLGLVSFAVSLGAKDLVTDIIAGLSIVFEGEYQVGDIIEVNGYRGKVLEIGVRSTKLEGAGNNIKIINNRDVKNVLNMTRNTSWYPLAISISSDQPIDKIEDMLNKQLPLIGRSIPEIISGPYYRGISGIGKGTITLYITAECNEADYYVVERALNRAIQEFFDDRKIQIL